MIASAYIKDGNMCLYSENRDYTDLGGVAYILGKPLLSFICYEPERFDDAFNSFAETFEVPGAEYGMHEPAFKAELKTLMTEMQINEPYIFFYERAFMNAVYNGQSPRKAFAELTEDFRSTIAFAKHEVEMLLAIREKFPDVPPMEYLYILDIANERDFGEHYFLEQPFKTFYGVTKEPEIAELYEIEWVRDLLRFELIKMIENNVFIKKCKNCGWFFIPNRRQDAEYCDRAIGDTNKKCSEIGAMLRYEKKVADDPVWAIYKQNYRRQNSRTRVKKLTQTEFLNWSEQAAQKRDKCIAGTLAFDDYVAWLEQGRIRKPRSKKPQDTQ
ncbi:hypothetical protein FACS189425_03280 [Clostridia bacterium]|nr:hypothetical protein FACS189425_03280 [Clostridia bacterium]